MNIALLGYGKMGKMIETAAVKRGHQIVAKINSQSQFDIRKADVCIDFSHPNAVLDNIQSAVNEGKNIVVGTTGWYHHLEKISKIVNDGNIGFFYSPNFSIGMNLFLRITEAAATLINEYRDYDVSLIETHHNQKKDTPSGTARDIAKILLDRISCKRQVVYNAEQVPPDALQVTSIRCGSVPGTHSVIFDSPCDTLTLTHEARNREGFATGAIIAAEWLLGKKGIYTMNDLFSPNKDGPLPEKVKI